MVVNKGHIAIGVVAALGLVLVLWLALADRGSPDRATANPPANRARLSEAELIAANREPPPAPAPVEAAPPAPPALTAPWLAGTWGPAENNPTNDPDAPCETDVVVTFFADGRYQQGDGSSGRFRTEEDRISFYEQLVSELGTDEDDHSQFDQTTTSRVVTVDQNEIRIDGEPMRRCRT